MSITDIMAFIFVGIVIITILTAYGYKLYNIIKSPTKEDIENFTEWLLYAVAEAERYFGSGTGQLKLRYVYDLALEKFPNVISAIPFEAFSGLVDNALDKFKVMLRDNKKLQEYIQY